MNDLIARHSEPWRKYHTLQHLRECVAWFEQVASSAEHPAEVEIALWFHDAVYALDRSDNEEQSADLARSALLAAEVPAAVAERVATLVLITKHSALPATPDEQLVVDIDLAILGASELRFAEYEAQIRAEYSFVPDALFREKRREILLSFLARPRIYSTPLCFERLEANARKNLAQAVGDVGLSSSPAINRG